jgi:hypothetical protein
MEKTLNYPMNKCRWLKPTSQPVNQVIPPPCMKVTMRCGNRVAMCFCNGSAYAPNGKPATKVKVSLKVGSLSKSFHVVGNRFWKKGSLSISASRPNHSW